VQGLNPRWVEIYCTHADQPSVPPSFVYNTYIVSFPEVKHPVLGSDHPPPLSSDVKEGVELNTKHINTMWAECQFLRFKTVGARNQRDSKG